jgi:integrase/recombinase XerC
MAPFFLIDNFIKYLQIEKRFSSHTLVAYENDIKQFLDFTSIQSQNELKEVNPMLIRSWVVALIDKGIENKSVNRKLSSLRSFFKWLKKEGVIESNPLKTIVGPKNSKRLPSFAKESELNKENLNDLFSDDFEGVRDRLILEVFYQTGIRLSELINLKESDVSQNSLKVIGKRNKERIIPVTNELKALIDQYRALKSSLELQNDTLFILKNGKKIYPKFVYRKINNYLSLVTKLDKCSPHVLRHTFATHMLNNGAGLETLREILGHANLTATQVYTHNSFTKLTSIYSQAHPRGRKND